MAGSRASPPQVLFLLGFLTLGGLAARLSGIGSRLPHRTEPDSVIVQDAAWLDRPDDMERKSGEAYSANFYPRLLAFTLHALPGRAFAHVLPAEAPLEDHLAAAAGPFVRARLLVALISLASIPATFFLARRFLPPWGALLASAFVATSLIGQFYAQQARPHAASMALSLLAVLAVLRLSRSEGMGAFALAGAACALAIGCLWNGVFVLPALVAALALGRRRRGSGIALALGISALAIPAFYGFLFEGPLLKTGGLRIGGQSLGWRDLNAAGFGLIARGFWSFDPVLAGAAAVGALFLAARFLRGPRPSADRLRELAIAAAFPASFLFFWGIISRVPPRFALPLLPYAAVLAAFGLRSLVPARAPRSVLAAAGLVALALPAYASWHLARLRASDDTYTLAARWIAEHADRERDVVVLPYLADLPLFAERAALERLPSAVQSPWQRYQVRLPREAAVPVYRLHTLFEREALADRRFDREEARRLLAAEAADYAVVVRFADSGIGWDSTREVLRENRSELLESFLSYRPGAEETLEIGFEEGERALEKVLSATRPGAPIEIYRVRAER